MTLARVAVALCSIALVACPAPTGRQRGVVDATPGGSCSMTATPFMYASCYVEGDVCPVMVSCGTRLLGEIATNTCTCTNGTWQCVMGPCQSPFYDAGRIACPPSQTLTSGTPCTAREGGEYCAGAPICDNAPLGSDCWCSGTHWACSSARCHDAGMNDASSDSFESQDGGVTDGPTSDAGLTCPADVTDGACMPGIVCAYAMPGRPECQSSCECAASGAGFTCGAYVCSDAGRADASSDF